MAIAFRHVVALAGGVGGAKLAHGLAQVLPAEALTVIVNTGDDFWHYGLRVCPDLDTVMYTLGGLVDPVNGWGVSGDSTAALGALARYGETPWFRLGDQDIATHLLRTQALTAGERLTEVTARLSRALGIGPSILPMCDAPVATIIDTAEHGELAFQDYFVRHRWQPTVRGLRFAGAEAAQASPEVLAALQAADAIVIAPSNPWLSLAPMLAVQPIRALLEGHSAPRVAVSPIVAGRAIKGPAAKLMAELGYPVTPQAIADYYGQVICGFVADEQDVRVSISQPVLHTNTVMKSDADRAGLASRILVWLAELRS